MASKDFYKGLAAPDYQGTIPGATPRYNKTTKTYDPNADMTGKSEYSGAETSAVGRLNSIIAHGGYSPEQKQTMIQGAMAPVYDAAEVAKKKAEADAYARGVGQSSVLSRSYGDVDKSVLSNLAQITGNVEKEGADKVNESIQLVQSGAAQKADYQAQKAQLAAQLNMNDSQMDQAFAQINSAADANDADRMLQYDKIKNDYNLSQAQFDLLVAQAKNDQYQTEKDRKANFWANIIGSAASVAGAAIKPV